MSPWIVRPGLFATWRPGQENCDPTVERFRYDGSPRGGKISPRDGVNMTVALQRGYL